MKEVILGYNVERKKIKNINIRIKSDFTIYISAPLYLPTQQIEQFIISKKYWIENTIKKIENYRKNFIEETLEDGTNIRFLGKLYNLKVNLSNFNNVILKEDTIELYTKTNNFDDKKKIIDKFYFEEAKKLFNQRITILSNKMNLKYDRLIIKEIKGKWGYCQNTNKIIALNLNLIKRSLFEIDYVVVHELAHLVHPNHSKSFYNYVESYFPNYKHAENLLKRP